jgi:hypothetical protein
MLSGRSLATFGQRRRRHISSMELSRQANGQAVSSLTRTRSPSSARSRSELCGTCRTRATKFVAWPATCTLRVFASCTRPTTIRLVVDAGAIEPRHDSRVRDSRIVRCRSVGASAQRSSAPPFLDIGLFRKKRNDTPAATLALMTYADAILVLTSLATGIIALNVWYQRHRSCLTQRQAQRLDREHEVECSIW